MTDIEPQRSLIDTTLDHCEHALNEAVAGRIEEELKKAFIRINQLPLTISHTQQSDQVAAHYSHYLTHVLPDKSEEGARMLFSDMRELASILQYSELQEEDPAFYLLQRLSRSPTTPGDISPIVAFYAAHLYGATDRLPVQVRGWYGRTLENLGNAQLSLEKYIAALSEHRECTLLLSSFLSEIKADITTIHGTITHLTSMYAMHAQQEDCAVYTGLTPHTFNGSEDSMKRRMRELLTFPVYRDRHKDMNDCCGVHGNTVFVPTYVSAVDVEQFSELWKNLWNASFCSLSKKMRPSLHFFRPTASVQGQARIGWNFPVGAQIFGVRIDKEEKISRRLSFDVGNASLEQAMNYAMEIGLRSTREEIVMRYSSILDKQGTHAFLENPREPYPRHKEFFYPSVMNSTSAGDINARAGLVASVIFEQAQGIGLFQNETFSYHARDLRINQPEFVEHFADIAHSYKNCASY